LTVPEADIVRRRVRGSLRRILGNWFQLPDIGESSLKKRLRGRKAATVNVSDFVGDRVNRKALLADDGAFVDTGSDLVQRDPVPPFAVLQSPIDRAHAAVGREQTIVNVEQKPESVYVPLPEDPVEIYGNAQVHAFARQFIQAGGLSHCESVVCGPFSERDVSSELGRG